jgi:hypothetical protein
MTAIEIYPREYINISWKMNFDGAKSRIGVGVGIKFVYPMGDTLCHAFHLEF